MPALLITGCATTPSVLDPRHDPSNPSAAESPVPKSSTSLLDDVSESNIEDKHSAPTAPDTGMKGMEGMPGMPAPTASPVSTANKTIYTCRMHPEVEQDHPGKCPKCGMTLIPKKSEAHQ